MLNDAFKAIIVSIKCGFIHHVDDVSVSAVMNICINLVNIDIISYLVSIILNSSLYPPGKGENR